MTSPYWPWWLGGVLLAGVAILFPLLNRSPLGVSGFLARLIEGDRAGTHEGSACADASAAPAACGGDKAAGGPDRWGSAVFLGGVLVGGVIAGLLTGQRWGQAHLSPEFHRFFGTGFLAVIVLFGGGVLVGFGTRLSGGCTSGHGLSGCGRLQPASLAATAVFFGVAIAASFLLERLRS